MKTAGVCVAATGVVALRAYGAYLCTKIGTNGHKTITCIIDTEIYWE